MNVKCHGNSKDPKKRPLPALFMFSFEYRMATQDAKPDLDKSMNPTHRPAVYLENKKQSDPG